MNQIIKIAVVILIVLGMGVGIVWFAQGDGGAGIAFADVVQPLLTARTATYKITTKQEDGASREAEVMFMEPGRTRITTRDGRVMVMDSQRGRAVNLNPEDKTALVVEMQNMERGPDLQSRAMQFFNTREYIRKALENEQQTVKYLGNKVIDGRRAVGYQISQDLREMTVWADATTQSPIRIENTIMMGKDKLATHVMDRFAFNVELDEALFSLDIPKSYTRENLKIDFSKPSEKDIIEMFRVWTAATDGEFPSALNMAAMKEFAEATVDKDIQKMEEELERQLAEIEKESKENPQQLEEKLPVYEPVYDIQSRTNDSMAVTRGLIFASTLPAGSNWHYAGKGVKLGEADRAIFWYRPEGSDVYRVIYGDLSINDMPEEDLPR